MQRDSSGGIDQTIKACPPFLDAMMTGYVISTEFDLFVSFENGVQDFYWKAGGQLVTTHNKTQIDKKQIPDGYSDQPWKFTNYYKIKTPSGYSTLFMHPLNRDDLPFRTLSGMVETDGYTLPVNFPFFLKKDFEGIIPAGTPIVQLVPIKRELWKMSLEKIDEKEFQIESLKFHHKIISSYKSTFWKKKEYK